MGMEQEIKGMAINHGWDYCGIADLTPYHSYLEGFFGPFISRFPRAVSLIIRLSNAVVDAVERVVTAMILLVGLIVTISGLGCKR